ncbi:glycine, glutamate and proline-rich protein-like [Mizuhopecten yessoensis]|uniref:glycine, glutamate and proline-rich protein-like n=1 Tax=Mizuhopecten yessoensis TaxID=6573 RepID=UPI000B45B34C|nr:glycine, glutamate and proline-rich protein-like [Mizuhopecten yessoensis]
MALTSLQDIRLVGQISTMNPLVIVTLLAISTGAWAASYTCHGDVRRLHPTGEHNGGVAASNHDVDYDLHDLNNKKSCYYASGAAHCIQPSVIAALASRESRGGRLLTSTGGWGDHHHAYGILQCDIRYHSCQKYAWDSCEHIEQMVSEVLVPYVNQVAHKHPTWSRDQQLQGGIAAYNSGVSNVQTWAHLDVGTTGNDYSNDVVARAKHLIASHNWH